MGQSALQSRDNFMYVGGLEYLSLKYFPEEFLPKYIFRNALYIQKKFVDINIRKVKCCTGEW